MEAKLREDIAELFRLARGARHFVALTGAGISTLSGIRDFRGKNGLYNEMDANKIFSLEWFKKDPALYYDFARSFIFDAREKEPSVAHCVLAEFESRGFLKSVITQNIDFLHQKGGSKNVIEIHGSPSTHYCLRCPGASMGFEEAARILRAGRIPQCPKCGRALKPAITFFGESLPESALSEAMGEASKADLMLILGTSLSVHPAACIPELTLSEGGQIVIVNDMPTHLDRHAALRFGELEPVCEGLRELLALESAG